MHVPHGDPEQRDIAIVYSDACVINDKEIIVDAYACGKCQ
jgi:hypothetical protein